MCEASLHRIAKTKSKMVDYPNSSIHICLAKSLGRVRAGIESELALISIDAEQ